MRKDYALSPVDSASRPIWFTFDYDLQVATGPDADRVNNLVREAVDFGSIPTGIPCCSYPVGDSLEEAELGSLLSYGWVVADDFPALVLPDELVALPDVPGLVS